MSDTDVITRSPAWHARRLQHIGGSEIAALFGAQPDYALSHYALWHVKAGRVPAPEVDGERIRWGLRLESFIAGGAAEQEGWTIRKGGYVSDPTTHGMGCTLDYVIEAPGPNDEGYEGPGALELKNADWLVHKRAWTNDEPPSHILLQHQHQLGCTGYSWGAVACLVGGNELRIYRYAARPKLIAEIRRRVADFWASIAEGRVPAVDGSDGASAVLAALYPELADDAIDMSDNNEWAEAADEMYAAAAARKLANDRYDAAKNRIAAILGPHRRGFGNGWAVNVAVTPANPGREPKPGELIGKRAEVRRYTVKETAA